jgi:hypothetical protein
MTYWFIKFETWLARTFGYTFVVHFEDTMTFCAGIFIGAILMAFLAGIVVFKLQKVKNLGSNNVKLLGFKHDGVQQYIADPHSVGESIETLLLVIFRPIFTNKEYDFRDEKRTRNFLIIMCIIGVVVLILAYISVTNIIVDNIPLVA